MRECFTPPAMNSLVKEFQRDLVDSSKSATELLRHAKLISAKLGRDDITAWIDLELYGYGADAPVPTYRIIEGGRLMVFNPRGKWEAVGQVRKSLPTRQPVAELE